MKSRTDKEDPSFVIPNTDNVEPKRRKLLSDTAEPTVTKSRTDKDEPSLAMP